MSCDLIAMSCWLVSLYECACREPLFNARLNDEELVAMLLGYKPLPWEANPAHISQHVHSQAAGHLVRHLLRYCPLLSCAVLAWRSLRSLLTHAFALPWKQQVSVELSFICICLYLRQQISAELCHA